MKKLTPSFQQPNKVESKPARHRTFSNEDMREKLDEEGTFYVLIDLSPEDHYAREHLPNAINIPLGENLEKRLSKLAPDKETLVVVYSSESESSLAINSAKRIESLGYPEVFVLEEGERAWKLEQRPLERNQAP